MQTNFSLAQLADADVAESEKILRNCVHCGFCIATCPTFVLLGDELDSPRGRIYLIKDMLEGDRPASDRVVKHVDRCLSCLSCMTTCPSGVNYMHLVDHARNHIERTYNRPAFDRAVRAILAAVMPYPGRFRVLLRLAKLGRAFSRLMPGRLKAMLALAPSTPLSKPLAAGRIVWPAEGERRKRVILMQGCVQQVLAARINEATVRLLTRLGCEVIVADGSGCCGALTHHLGREAEAYTAIKANVDAWTAEMEVARSGGGIDAIIVNASGCGTTVKDYGFMLRTDDAYADRANDISMRTRDISEFLTELGEIPAAELPVDRVTYHSACSLQHGQKVTEAPKILLQAAGFDVTEPAESHLCCGSAGTYNMMQPDIANRLRDRKADNISRTRPEAIATGNIGCMMQLQDAVDAPVVHTVELLDWATGGPAPAGLDGG
ncbi:MAG: glycolate oxidase subunit GlcF [Rhodospirillaceae bacterium]|nr:MAG: glycolate oxidase subunit GlcF [Rhodospirillaceae bacterium]